MNSTSHIIVYTLSGVLSSVSQRKLFATVEQPLIPGLGKPFVMNASARNTFPLPSYLNMREDLALEFHYHGPDPAGLDHRAMIAALTPLLNKKTGSISIDVESAPASAFAQRERKLRRFERGGLLYRLLH